MPAITQYDCPCRKSGRLDFEGSCGEVLSHEQVEQARDIAEGKIEFMEDERFHQKDADRVIFDDAPRMPRADAAWYLPAAEGIAETSSSPQSPSVLTKKQEQALFVQYNYSRFRLAELQEKIQTGGRMTERRACEILFWHGKANELRETIAHFNLPLVLAMIKYLGSSNLDRSELIGEGNVALLNAIDKYRADKGFKFSTYACRSILSAFARLGAKTTRYQNAFPVTFDPELEQPGDPEQTVGSIEHADDISRMLRVLRENEANLSDIEQQVIRHRFPMDAADDQPMTLTEIGKIIGCTKERVRQIQIRALEKLRESMDEALVKVD